MSVKLHRALCPWAEQNNFKANWKSWGDFFFTLEEIISADASSIHWRANDCSRESMYSLVIFSIAARIKALWVSAIFIRQCLNLSIFWYSDDLLWNIELPLKCFCLKIGMLSLIRILPSFCRAVLKIRPRTLGLPRFYHWSTRVNLRPNLFKREPKVYATYSTKYFENSNFFTLQLVHITHRHFGFVWKVFIFWTG